MDETTQHKCCVCDLSWGSCKKGSYGYAKRSSATLGFHFDWVAGGWEFTKTEIHEQRGKMQGEWLVTF